MFSWVELYWQHNLSFSRRHNDSPKHNVAFQFLILDDQIPWSALEVKADYFQINLTEYDSLPRLWAISLRWLSLMVADTPHGNVIHSISDINHLGVTSTHPQNTINKANSQRTTTLTRSCRTFQLWMRNFGPFVWTKAFYITAAWFFQTLPWRSKSGSVFIDHVMLSHSPARCSYMRRDGCTGRHIAHPLNP